MQSGLARPSRCPESTYHLPRLHLTSYTCMQSVEWEKTYAQDLLSSNLTSVSSMPLTSEPGPITLVTSRADLQPVLSPFAGFAARAEAAGDSDGTVTPRHRRVSTLCVISGLVHLGV